MKKHVILACLVLLGMCVTARAQIAPQIQGAGAPANPCANGGQQYVDQTNHVLYGCPNSGGNWVNLGLGNLTGGGAGSVTHTAGNLTAFHLMLGNGLADSTVDSACLTNGTGTLSGCTSISAGSGASAAGATATGGFACVEGASTGWTPTVGQDYIRCDSTLHNYAVAVNGAAETPLPVFSAVPAGSKCLQSSGVAGLIAEAAGACASTPSFPVTVAGTVTSGGIPYFNSTVQESSSSLLAANGIMFGGGAGAPPATDTGFLYGSAIGGIISGSGPGINWPSRAGIAAIAANDLEFPMAFGGAGAFMIVNNLYGTNDFRLELLAPQAASWSILEAGQGGGAAPQGLGIGTASTYPISFRPNRVETVRFPSGGGLCLGAGACDTNISRDAAGVVDVGNGTQGDVTGTIKPGKYATGTNCSSSASPAVCGSAAAGSVAVPTGVTPTLVVNTTAVTANSQILFTPDESLGTKLSVTCNSTIAQVAIEPIVTARTAATSFTIQYNTTITTNPICLSYLIVN